jgi:hypothetical protein
MLKVCVGCVGVLTLSACAGRAPQLAPLVMVSDRQLDCTEIEAETRLNNQRISDLAIERGWKMGQNAVAGVMGFMIWPAWLGLDLQDAAGKEAASLSQRNEYLLALARERCHPANQMAGVAVRDPEPATELSMSPLASNAEITPTLSLASH